MVGVDSSLQPSTVLPKEGRSPASQCRRVLHRPRRRVVPQRGAGEMPIDARSGEPRPLEALAHDVTSCRSIQTTCNAWLLRADASGR